MISKCVKLEANGQLAIRNEKLSELAASNCRIKIVHAGVCSSDIYRGFAKGAYFYPLTMGHEFAGIIEEIGQEVTGFKKGDRVAAFPLLPCFICDLCVNQNYAQCADYKYYGSRNDGAFAQYLDVKEWNLLKIPSTIDLADAALMEPLAVVVHGLKKLGLFNSGTKSGSLLMIGFGFLGRMFLELVQKLHPNMALTVVDRNAPKLSAVKSSTVNKVCLKADDDWVSFMQNNGSKFDFVAEMSGHPSSFDRSITAAKQGAKVLWLSNITDSLTLSQKQVSQILRKELIILGTWNSTFKKKGDNDWQDCLQLMEDRVILPSQLVSHYISLEELPYTLKQMYLHKTKKAKFDCVKVSVNFEANFV